MRGVAVGGGEGFHLQYAHDAILFPQGFNDVSTILEVLDVIFGKG